MKVLMPLPDRDFDPTESSVPWRVLTDAGYQVVFATPQGEPAEADPRMVTGKGLGPWKPLLRARSDARRRYEEMTEDLAFLEPLSYEQAAEEDFDGMILPGGHAPGMKSYLESERLQRMVARHMESDQPLGAVCHGVVLVARATLDGESVLRGRKTTALTASMELSAWAMTCLWLGDYYRTYEETVQSEVEHAVGDEGVFETGPPAIFKDAPDRLDRGFTVRDGNYLSARWPGDAYRFASEFVEMLEGQ